MLKRFYDIGKQRFAAAAALMAVLMGGVWFVAGAADNLGMGRARSELQRLFGADFKRDQVQVRSIRSGQGDNVIVEAQIETAFRFVREGRDWRVAEIRLGDRNWESVELVEEALRREKARRTEITLMRFADGLDYYRRERGRYVEAEEIGRLLDELVPRYLSPLVRFDLWGTPFVYQGTAERYRIASAGPDRRAGTEDDVILENGELKPQGE
jgi:hypothetical protein